MTNIIEKLNRNAALSVIHSVFNSVNKKEICYETMVITSNATMEIFLNVTNNNTSSAIFTALNFEMDTL
jgi:hypothetical protein